MRNLCVIPVRMGSSRFPGKPLKKLLGLELVWHIYERCRLARSLDRIIITTCDEEIRDVCAARGAEVVMTRKDHPGAVDRTAEAAGLVGDELADYGLVLMVQGDEVLVAPDMIDPIVKAFESRNVSVVNLVSPIEDTAEHDSPSVVKVAFAPDGRALFFSRASIPSRTRVEQPALWQQTGGIGFQKSFLETFLRLPQTPLEQTEGIDMLRTIEHGYDIQIVKSPRVTIGVDTPEELVRAENILIDDPHTSRYLGSIS